MTGRRLVRTADLAGFRRAVARLALEGAPLDARRRAVIVPTRASIELLRQTLEREIVRSGKGDRDLAGHPDAR